MTSDDTTPDRAAVCTGCGHHWIAHAPTVPGCSMCDCVVPLVTGSPADLRAVLAGGSTEGGQP